MYRYQLITCRYCSPKFTSVVISLRTDLPTSSPIPFVLAINRYCSLTNTSDAPLLLRPCSLCLRENWAKTREVRPVSISFTIRVPYSTLGFSLRFNSLGLFYPSPKRVHLVPVFIARTSVLRSIRPYLAHVQPVAHLHLHLKVTVLVGPMRDGLHADISIATPLAS